MKTNSSNVLNRILQTLAQCAQIRRLLPLAFIVAMLTSRADAQNVPADQVAQAIDDLSQATLAKIDSEIEINARAFADAKNIQSSLVWGDWFRPILDIAYGVYEAMTIIPDKNPNSVRTWLKTSIQAADAGKKGFSIFGSFDRLRQDGATLALAIDGPAYNSSVSAMLDRADATSFFFNYALYKTSVQNDLYGTFWQANPLRVSHKSTAFDRSGGGVFNSILEARSYIASQFATLSAQMRQTQLPSAQISSLVSFIQARRQDVLQCGSGRGMFPTRHFFPTAKSSRRGRFHILSAPLPNWNSGGDRCSTFSSRAPDLIRLASQAVSWRRLAISSGTLPSAMRSKR